MATSDNDGRPFPEDVAMEILTRLPVRSLLRFKCVGKHWYEIITSPSFIKEHMNRKSPQILIYNHTAPDYAPPIYFISVSDAGAIKYPLDYLRGFRGMAYLLGSVDGLFLLEREIDGSIFDISLSLWNPATREVRPLPAVNVELSPSFTQMRSNFGFGLDPITNDYKVVWFRSFWDDDRNQNTPEYAAIYSCSKDSWRVLEPANLVHEFCAEATGTAYLNGTYYWLLCGGFHNFDDCSILSFDFSNEVFAEITGPDVGRITFNHFDVRLVLLDDFIALMIEVAGFVYDIWVMIQPDVWIKQFTVKTPSYILSWYSSTLIFIDRRCRLFSYDVRTQTTRNLGFRHTGLRRGGDKEGRTVHFFKESLVRIKRENGEPNH